VPSTYFPEVWFAALTNLILNGHHVSPRGQVTKEIPQRTIVVDMRRPVLTVPARRLSYKFMAAEAWWILTGDDRVETIAPYNKVISQFSDDGETFFGAYGPKIVQQLHYVVDKLEADINSRQAGLTIWRENPPETRDVPCTVAVFFNIRDGKLNCHNFMRSSDIWLGIPYDVFNFSMLSHLICAHLNSRGQLDLLIRPGNLYLTAASSHLYEWNEEEASQCLQSKILGQPETPDKFYHNPASLIRWLRELRDEDPGSFMRWWEL